MTGNGISYHTTYVLVYGLDSSKPGVIITIAVIMNNNNHDMMITVMVT